MCVNIYLIYKLTSALISYKSVKSPLTFLGVPKYALDFDTIVLLSEIEQHQKMNYI